jgi:Peptidase family M28/PDZ domain
MKKSGLLLVISFFIVELSAQWHEWQQIHVDVVYLASDDLEGRETGSQGEKLAADYISRRMQRVGLRPAGDQGSWFQSFQFSSNPHENKTADKTGTNVLGFLDRKAKKTVILGAHYDHLGYGHSGGSLAPNDHSIHNGADDNASGIASLLWLAENLAGDKKLKVNVLFIAFSGEELGLYGSKAVAAKAGFEPKEIMAMINMDMVGRLNAEKSIAIGGVGTSKEWKEMLERCKPAGFNFNMTESGIGPSDHTSFYLKDIPVLFFFTGQHTDYHKPSDDSRLVNHVGILEISRIIRQLVHEISKDGALEFQKTKDENKQSVSFKVTLGVMPDYVYSGEGMRIDAVLDDRPAKKAGLQAGDIIVELAGMPIKDVYAYMEALAKCSKGQKAKVKVMRKEQPIEFEVEF